MRLHELTRSKGLRKKSVRRGRGNATGRGNYSGRGLKGQKSRSGHSMKQFFEGGQTSIVQRLPKARGFKRPFKLVNVYQLVNLGKLNRDERITDKMEITKPVLKQFGYVKNENGLVKILGDGEYTKHLTFTGIDSFSASAQAKIDKPGTPSKTSGKPYAKIDKTLKAEQKKLKAQKMTQAQSKKKPAPVKPVAKPAEKPVKPTVARQAKIQKAPAAKPVVKPVDKPIGKPAGKPVVKPAVKPAAKPAAKLVAKPVVKKPAAKLVAKPIVKKPAAKPVAKPTAKPAAKKPAAKPVVKKSAAKKPAAKKSVAKKSK